MPSAKVKTNNILSVCMLSVTRIDNVTHEFIQVRKCQDATRGRTCALTWGMMGDNGLTG